MKEDLITIITLPYSKAMVLKMRFEAEKIECILENIILIDDVVTTGSTLEEIAKSLKENGASKVYGLAVAKD